MRMTLASILRVDAHLHRRLPADTELCQAIGTYSTNLIGQLHHCLQHQQQFSEAKAFPTATSVGA